jgi:uncharacterized protein
MKRFVPRWFAVLFLLMPFAWAYAENPSTLPIPTRYVNDFAHILTPAGAQKIEDLCKAVQNQADAQLFVVTVNSLDGGMTIDEFTEQLEEHWKAGKKGQDRSAILLRVVNPHGFRIETGYGLEGILNDAKVGRILDSIEPLVAAGNYDGAMYTATKEMADAIAADKGVTLNVPVHQYHYQGQRARGRTGPLQILLGIGFILLIVILVRTGNLGWALWLIFNLMGSGGGGGGGRDDDDRGGGGFGGIGGGSSGGGGASRDF